MKICVVGAGAVGGVLAFRLAAAGHEVSVVARGAHLEAIKANGLTLIDHLAERRVSVQPVAASNDPASFGVQDIVFIALKAHAIPDMLPRMKSLIGPDTMVVPAINGVPWWYFQHEGSDHDGLVVNSVDPRGDMNRVLPPAHVIACVVHASAEVTAPGVVNHTNGRLFVIGEIDRRLADPITPRLQKLAAAIDGAGLDATVSKNVRHDVWAKLIGNLSFNPVAALTFADMSRICASEELLDVIRAILREGKNVARSYGVYIAMTPDERIDIARYLGGARISMHQDFAAHRKPEIDAIVSSVIELAERVSIAVPATRMMRSLVVERAISEGLLPPRREPHIE
jgi:2-dehydropantoate 2-reductase